MDDGHAEQEVVRELIARRLAGPVEEALEVLADDAVLEFSDGTVHVGHDGYIHWFQERLREYADATFAEREIEYLGSGWTLVNGSVTYVTRGGERQVVPGSWLVRVRGRKVASLHYFRTQAEARAALAGSRES